MTAGKWLSVLWKVPWLLGIFLSDGKIINVGNVNHVIILRSQRRYTKDHRIMCLGISLCL